MEMEDHQRDHAYLLGRIDALEHALEVTVAMLPEKQRDFVSRQVSAYARETERQGMGTAPAEAARGLEHTMERAESKWPEAFRAFSRP